VILTVYKTVNKSTHIILPTAAHISNGFAPSIAKKTHRAKIFCIHPTNQRLSAITQQ